MYHQDFAVLGLQAVQAERRNRQLAGVAYAPTGRKALTVLCRSMIVLQMCLQGLTECACRVWSVHCASM